MTAKVTSILFTALLSAVLHSAASPETDYIDGQLALIQTEFSVQIHYQYDTNLFFPADRLNGKFPPSTCLPARSMSRRSPACFPSSSSF
jgi:hypothetical protein